MAKKIQAIAPRPVTIDLSALFGRFQVPGSDFVVRFASTFASQDKDGHRELLSELKPMRDRVDASSIQDLTALLQRDLNDRRVATQLVPYLTGGSENAASRIGFFPAVLAVLVPKGYLGQGAEQEDQVNYPPSGRDEETGVYNYTLEGQKHFAWQVEPYQAEDGEEQPLGLLHINPNQTDIVVLDGQHRSNAFRYIAGAFDPKDQIYGEFYRDTERPENFTADLPVTIVWFEANNNAKIRPGHISRQLFVDVNNNARPVSVARTILLDDRSVSAIATQAFYNKAADARFEASSFSLLHSAFDMDSDLAEVALPSVALTSPEIAEAAFSWVLLGSDHYTNLEQWAVDRQRAKRNRDRFIRHVGDADNVSFGTEDDGNAVQVSAPEPAEHYRNLMDKNVAPVLSSLMAGLTLLKPHYEAASATDTWAEKEASHYERAAWEKIFKGGEGLYWTFRDRKIPENNTYREASRIVEGEFRKRRALQLGVDITTADAVFRSFATKAFQTGFVMAADYLAQRNVANGILVDAAETLITDLGRFTADNWTVFFRELRPLLVRGDTNPRVWPTYRNLLVRMYDEGRQEPLNDKLAIYPEERAFNAALDDIAERRAADQEDPPKRSELTRLVTGERDRILDIFKRSGLEAEWFGSDRTIERGRKYFLAEFDRLVSE